MNDLPIYKALITDENEGIFVISLVDAPATEINWMCFNKNKTLQKFKIADDDEHILSGVIMIADTPIYRVSPVGEEYYILFTKDVIKQMSEKMLTDNTFNNIDIQHNGVLLPGGKVKLVELFIADKNKGINPNYIEVPDGSLIANYKIYDNELWNEIKNGDLKGLSLEGYFTPELMLHKTIDNNFKKHNKTNKMNKVKEALRKLLVSLSEIQTDKGILEYEDELVEGVEIKIDNELAPDGEYISEENIIIVKDGKVIEIKEKVVDEKVVDEKVVDEKVVDEKVVDENFEEEIIENNPLVEPEADLQQIDEILEKINEHDLILQEINKSLEELNKIVKELNETPIVEPIEETFNKKLINKDNKAIEIASYLRK